MGFSISLHTVECTFGMDHIFSHRFSFCTASMSRQGHPNLFWLGLILILFFRINYPNTNILNDFFFLFPFCRSKTVDLRQHVDFLTGSTGVLTWEQSCLFVGQLMFSRMLTSSQDILSLQFVSVYPFLCLCADMRSLLRNQLMEVPSPTCSEYQDIPAVDGNILQTIQDKCMYKMCVL